MVRDQRGAASSRSEPDLRSARKDGDDNAVPRRSLFLKRGIRRRRKAAKGRRCYGKEVAGRHSGHASSAHGRL